jgi:ferric-dicitrate binding protein FerR (iron transport regulator)
MAAESNALWARIADYLSGECTPQERYAIEEWIAAHPDNRTLFDSIAQSWDLVRDRKASPVDTAALKTRIAARIGLPDLNEGARPAPRPAHRPATDRGTRAGRLFPAHTLSRGSMRPWALSAIAAAAMMMVIRHETRPVKQSEPAPQIATFNTQVGQRATVMLSDGSRVLMAPLSTVRITDGRTVELTGEAYFDIVHHATKAFVVHTGAVTTRVLGTAFNVRHYADDAAVRVAVASGKVVVGGSASRAGKRPASVTLVAGDVGRATDSTATAKTVGDVSTYTDWMTGRLAFRDTPVPEVLATLNRWYGYEFHLADPAVARDLVTARLDYGTPADMFTALKSLLNVTLSFDGKIVTLRRKNARSTPPTVHDAHEALLHPPYTDIGL